MLFIITHPQGYFKCSISSAAFGDMFPHKHVASKKLPFPIPPIPGWGQDTKPWDEYLYPPLSLKANELTRHRGQSVNLLRTEFGFCCLT